MSTPLTSTPTSRADTAGASSSSSSSSYTSHMDKQRKRWLKFLARDPDFEDNKTLKKLVRKGIPGDLRGRVWPLLCGATDVAALAGPRYYEKLSELAQTSRFTDTDAGQQIEKDLMRTMPQNADFASKDTEGVQRLRRILLAYSAYRADIGYCQSLNFIVAYLLFFMEERMAFWVLVAVTDNLTVIRPPDDDGHDVNYYQSDLAGVRVDQAVFAALVREKLPKVHKKLVQLNIPIEPLTVNWFLCLFVNTLPTETLLRVWDCLFYEGPKIIFRAGLALLKTNERYILAAPTLTDLLVSLQANAAKQASDPTAFLKLCFDSFRIGSLPMSKISLLRHFHLAKLLKSAPAPSVRLAAPRFSVSSVEKIDRLIEEDASDGIEDSMDRLLSQSRRISAHRASVLAPAEEENSALDDLQAQMAALLAESNKLVEERITSRSPSSTRRKSRILPLPEEPEESSTAEDLRSQMDTLLADSSRLLEERHVGAASGADSDSDSDSDSDAPAPPPPPPAQVGRTSVHAIPDAFSSDEEADEPLVIVDGAPETEVVALDNPDEWIDEVTRSRARTSSVAIGSIAAAHRVSTTSSAGPSEKPRTRSSISEEPEDVDDGDDADYDSGDEDEAAGADVPLDEEVEDEHQSHQAAPATYWPSLMDAEAPSDVQDDGLLNHMSGLDPVQDFQVCGGCKKPVTSGASLFALGQIWHPEHFQCKVCEMCLDGVPFYPRDDAAYCEADYNREFGQPCGICGEYLVSGVASATSLFHRACVKCSICAQGVPEDTDDIAQLGFFYDESTFYCAEDYAKHVQSKCFTCGEPIDLATEPGTRVQGREYHQRCLVCSVAACARPLADVAAEGGTVLASSSFEGLMYCQAHAGKLETSCRKCYEPLGYKGVEDVEVAGRKFHQKCAETLPASARQPASAAPGAAQGADGDACPVCGLKLFGRVLSIGGRRLHAECLRCASCEAAFDMSSGSPGVYTRGEAVFCKPCYQREFMAQCGACAELIVEGRVMGLRVEGKVVKYHASCFRCAKCKLDFVEQGRGASQVVLGGKLLCMPCGVSANEGV